MCVLKWYTPLEGFKDDLFRVKKQEESVPNPFLGPFSEVHKHAGVDLNRNYGFLWEGGIGTQENGMNLTYAYKRNEPLSEPESKNVRHLFDTFKNIKCFVDIHCHAGKILMSWGDDDAQCFYPEQNYRDRDYSD